MGGAEGHLLSHSETQNQQQDLQTQPEKLRCDVHQAAKVLGSLAYVRSHRPLSSLQTVLECWFHPHLPPPPLTPPLATNANDISSGCHYPQPC